MSAVSMVLFFLSLHDVGSWLSRWLLNIANFLMTFLSLKSHNLLWMERRDMFGWHVDHIKFSVVGALNLDVRKQTGYLTG